jgi:hypothetical protein
MAGAGYKLFQTGDVLTAAQVNTYLNEQTVMVFANSTARTSALSGVLAEGMVSYLQDTNAVEVYDGSNWVSIGSSGDITGVTAGTGISGGGTSGTVTITNDMATTITAAGDIVVGTGSGTYDNLPIGTTGQVLTADTTVSPYKVKWASAAGGGKLLQMVTATTTTDTSITATSFTDTNITATITPTSATSKILIMINTLVFASRSLNTTTNEVRILRGATTVTDFGNVAFFNGLSAGSSAQVSAVERHDNKTIHFVDSPASTSSLTYKLQARTTSTNNSQTIRFQPDNSVSSITLLEIGA